MVDVSANLVPIRSTGNRNPLYCVHPISGSPYSYTGMARLLEPELPVYAFEAPGFDDDRPPSTVLEDLSSEYVAALRSVCPDGPYNLLGWSMGGVIAFDMALRLAACGSAVSALVLIDAAAPKRAALPPVKDQLRRMLHDLMAAAGIPDVGLHEIFAQVADDVEPLTLFENIERAGLLPAEVDPDFLSHRFAIFRAHLRALFNYSAPNRCHSRITLIRAAESPPQYMDWRAVATNLETYVVPGDHHSMWTGENLGTLARITQWRLDAAEAERLETSRLP
jgi:thioesterase domain-containing protein